MNIIVGCQKCSEKATMEGNVFPEGWGPGSEPFTYRCPNHLLAETDFGKDPDMRWLRVKAATSAVEPYLGFGATVVDEGFRRTIVRIPKEHAEWLRDRLASGLHFGTIHENYDEAFLGGELNGT